MNVPMLYKTYKISKMCNKIHENLQVTYKIFEIIYLNLTEIMITRTNKIKLQAKLYVIRIQCLNFTTNDIKYYKKNMIFSLNKQYRKSNEYQKKKTSNIFIIIYIYI